MGANDRVAVVSMDCHIDPASPEVFRPYISAKYAREFDEWVGEFGARERARREAQVIHQQDFVKHYQSRRVASTDRFFGSLGYDAALVASRRDAGNMALTADPDLRLKELEADGVVAEVMYANGIFPFARLGDVESVAGAPQGASRDLQLEGIAAHNRWIADLCAAHPGRRVGNAILPPAYDVGEVVKTIEWAAEHGLKGAMCPQPTNPELPRLYESYYDPIWAAAAATGTVFTCHLGWGGDSVDQVMRGLRAGNQQMSNPLSNPVVRQMVKIEVYFLSRRALWILIFSGAFDRHPGLRVTFVEQQADWVPNTLAWLDDVDHRLSNLGREFDDMAGVRHGGGETPLQRRPSEYWTDHCMVSASMISRAEVAMRNEIGIGNIGFGTDYPHPEGTWPLTREWLNLAFSAQGVTESDLRAIMGENAARWYGLDLAQLQGVADRVGPKVSEFLEPDETLNPDTKSWLESRELGRVALEPA
jgi:predicted TIM-barrel fold metal-dependent hydrolase